MRSDRTKVLVTGVTGFVGLNLLHGLATNSIDVVGLADTPLPEAADRSLATAGHSPTVLRVDVTDAAAVSDALSAITPDVVIHAAAITASANREREDAAKIISVNMLGTQNVLDASTHVGVDRVVIVSSGAVYGADTFGTAPLDETTRAHPTGLYGITKHGGEAIARRHRELHGLDVVIGRLSALFGPWEYPTGVRDFMSPMLQMAGAVQRGEPVRYVEDTPRNWAYAPDAAEGIIRLALDPSLAHDRYNVCPDRLGCSSSFAELLRDDRSFGDIEVVESPEAASISYDADPRLERAPISGKRLRDQLGNRVFRDHDEALRDYLRWMEKHPGWV